jgi:phosphatidylethanolamine-binding protein (PEBP) family uncharacterized protein
MGSRARGVRRGAALALGLVVASCGGAGDELRSADFPKAPAALRVTSPAFADGAPIPRRFSCDGAGDEPAVRASGAPAAARELVLIVVDPDATTGGFVHLTRYGVPPRAGAAITGGREGRNSAGGEGWTPPCPPHGDRAHRYRWTVYALGSPSGLEAGADGAAVVRAVGRSDVLARGTLTGRFGRS